MKKNLKSIKEVEEHKEEENKISIKKNEDSLTESLEFDSSPLHPALARSLHFEFKHFTSFDSDKQKHSKVITNKDLSTLAQIQVLSA